MPEFEDKIKKVEIDLPKGKVVIALPEGIPVDPREIRRIEKQQREANLGTSNGVPATINLAAVSGDLLQSYRTTDEFSLHIDYVEGIVVLKAEHLFARTNDVNLKLVDSKVLSKVVIPLKDFIAARFNFLSLPPENPENGRMHVNEIWYADKAIVFNTRNVDDFTILGHRGVTLVSPEEELEVLFSVLFQAGKVTAKSVTTFLIVSTEKLTNYQHNAIDTALQ